VTFLSVLAWTGAVIIVLVVLLFAAVCVRLIPTILQERALSRQEAEQVDAELGAGDRFLPSRFEPYVPKRWQRSGDDPNDPREDRPRDTSPE